MLGSSSDWHPHRCTWQGLIDDELHPPRLELRPQLPQSPDMLDAHEQHVRDRPLRYAHLIQRRNLASALRAQHRNRHLGIAPRVGQY